MLACAYKPKALTGWKERCRGGTLVELTLIGLIFLALLLAIADFGQFLFIQQAIVERARAAARWGAATDPTDSAAIQNMVLYLQPAVPAGRTPSFGLAPSMVAVSTAGSGTANYRLVVQISGFSYQVLSPYLAGTYRGTPVSVSVPLGPYR
ncbi:MAG: TadE/TadG family type IV pilus assembly protein [Candidatus Sulfopaludibacter sp.]|nr:TadE/TadG family type IV pilus assembly protein [Candidatus Sulfopaludibacter sp.]